MLPVALALAACSSMPTAAPVSPTVEQTSPLPSASGLPKATPPAPSRIGSQPPQGAVRPCAQRDLAIGSVYWTGATAEMAGGFTVLNFGSSNCRIAGRASSLSILDPAGTPLKIEVKQFEPGAEGDVVILAPSAPNGPATPDGSGTGAQVFWTNWCGPWSRAGTLVVSFPNVGSVRASFQNLSAPRCDSPGRPSTLEVGPVAVWPQPT